MVAIANELLQARIHPRGAELQSLYHRKHEIEYMWNGDPAYWGKHSPVLFPVVGQLKDDSYTWQGKTYHLPRHGFAREKDFIVEYVDETSAVFALYSTEATRAVYPFDFILRLRYELNGAALSVAYEVTNTGPGDMYFSVGGHPAFAVPIDKNKSYNDYYIQFPYKEQAPRWLISDGLIDTPADFLQQENIIPLTHELFYKDALVFKHLHSGEVGIHCQTSKHWLSVNIDDFPYLGIWAAKDAPFVCLEPWAGIADSVHHNGLLEEKEGIIRLSAGSSRTHSWQVSCH